MTHAGDTGWAAGEPEPAWITTASIPSTHIAGWACCPWTATPILTPAAGPAWGRVRTLSSASRSSSWPSPGSARYPRCAGAARKLRASVVHHRRRDARRRHTGPRAAYGWPVSAARRAARRRHATRRRVCPQPHWPATSLAGSHQRADRGKRVHPFWSKGATLRSA